MGHQGRTSLPVLTLCLLAAGWGSAQAQGAVGDGRIAEITASTTGQIVGRVADETGRPVDGVVISALGSASAFAVSDRNGQFSLQQLAPGPYLLRAHREGFLTLRGSIVEVRPASQTPFSLTMRREGSPATPVVTEAGFGGAGAAQAADDVEAAKGPDESEVAWRLRHLKRTVLRDSTGMVALPENDDFFLTDSFERLGRAFGSSARAAGALFADLSLDGQVDLLTTGAFDNPLELLQMDRTHSVAFFSFGAPVGTHGEWTVRAALNQADLDSWIFAGSYAVKAQSPHRYQLGMSYGLQRLDTGNTAALATTPETSRNVGTVFGFDEWAVSRSLSIGYGATYAHYDYLAAPGLFSPRLTASFRAADAWRVRGLVTRQMSAPGAQELLPPTRATWLPPQRTFSPLSADGFNAQAVEHYEAGIERTFRGATLGVRAFRQSIDDQLVTVFGLRRPDSPAAALGHYYVGSAGNAEMAGWGVSLTHALFDNLRGSVDYSIANASWVQGARPSDQALLARRLPGLVFDERERIHDVLTTLETEVPVTATRVFVFYRLSNAFVKADDATDTRGVDGRFDLQVNQALPFMNFLSSQWEMLVAVRNTFHENMAGVSTYDELLVVRPPKRIVGGLTVRF
jgi:hypothetical protein